MKNIVCPISAERVQEHLPRLTALLVISLLGVYLATGSIVVLSFLLIDFIARGFGYAQYSLLQKVASNVSHRLNLKSELIDKAPKIFAARLGTIMIGMALILDLVSLQGISFVVASIIGVFATLECVANFCVGCYFYSIIVLPVFSHRS